MVRQGKERERERLGIIKECNKYIPKCRHKCCVFTDHKNPLNVPYFALKGKVC